MRSYQAIQGRWITPDPGGLAAVDPSNPQSWNRYSYALNNPLLWTDPFGLDPCPNDQSWGAQLCRQAQAFRSTTSYNTWNPFSLLFKTACREDVCWTTINPNALFGLLSGNSSPSPTWAFVKTFFTTLPSTGPGSCVQVALEAVKPAIDTLQSAGRNVPKYVPPVLPTLPVGSAWLGSQISTMVAAGAAEGEALGDASILATISTVASEAAPVVARAVPYVAAIGAELVGAYGVGKEAIAAAKGQCKP